MVTFVPPSKTKLPKLCEKFPNAEFFLVSVFPFLDITRTEYGDLVRIQSVFSIQSVFGPNTGKYKPEKTQYLGSFQI